MLNSIDDEGLFEAIENSWNEVCFSLASTPWGYIHHNHQIKYAYTGFLDGVWFTRLNAVGIDAKITDVKSFFRGKGILRWFVYPTSMPKDLKSYLEHHGFKKSGHGVPAMAINLKDVRKDIVTPEGLDIKVVNDEETLNTWSRVFLVGHGLGQYLDEGSRVFKAVGLKQGQRFTKYLGYYNSVPVASSQIFFGDEVARLNFVSTLPEARGKGVGTAVSHASLMDAYARGYKVAVLFSTDMGHPIYLKLGFKEIFEVESYTMEDRSH